MPIRSVGATALALCMSAVPAMAQDADAPFSLQQAIGDPDDFTISASARVRYETISNHFRPGASENDDIVALQFRLAAEYDGGPVRVGGEMSDSRVYGANAGSVVGTGDVNAFELIQAYIGADLGDALGEGSETSLTAGRFTLDLGSRRLVGRNNYRNATNAFTGLRADFTGSGGSQVTAFATFPQQRLPDDKASILDNEVKWDREGDDLIFYGAFARKPGLFADIDAEIYFYGLDEDDRIVAPTRDRKLYTPGFRLERPSAVKKLDFEIEYAHQFGSISASSEAGAARQDVSAQFVHLEAGYLFAADWKPRLAMVYDLATGDKPGGGYGRFDSLYGPRRFDFGPTGIFGPLGRNNISALGADFEFKPSARIDGFIKYRAAWLDSATDSFASTRVRDPAGLSGKFGGHQIEGRVRYWLVPDFLRLDTGAAVLVNGRFLKDAPNANGFGNTVYGYVDATVTL